MAIRGFTLKDEERRRQLTIAALAAGLVISTLPVTNERALFSPFADLPLLGNFSPVAYAMFTGFGPGGGMGGGDGPGFVPPGTRGPAGGRPVPPLAYGARVPPGVPVGPAALFPPAPLAPPVANFVRPIPGGIPPGFPLVPGFGPDEPIGLPDTPGPISVGGENPVPPPVSPVPEPAAWGLLMVGFATIGALLRRRSLRRPAPMSGISEG